MYKNFKNPMIVTKAFVIMLSLLIGLPACSDSDSDDGNGGGQNADNTEITIIPERTKMLRNPLNGWVLYTGLGDGLSDTFWETYDNFDSSKGKVKVSDYATTLYIRAAWSLFNPEEGLYVWDEACNTVAARRFRFLVKGAEERNLKLAFTFIVDSRDKSFNFTPDFVKNAAGIEGFTSGTNGSRWSPYPDNPVFQKYFEKFIADFAAKYDNPDVTEFVSGFGLGLWGEGHSMIYSTGNASPRESVFNWAVDLYTKYITKVPLIINYHRCILTTGGFTDTPNADSERLLKSAVDKGYSVRHDAFGMKGYYKEWERAFAVGMRYKRPIIAEGGWVKNSHGNSIKGDGYANYADVRRGEFSDAKEAQANMLDFRYSSDIANGETYSWFNEAYSLVEQFIAEGGYRLYPNTISLPEEVKNGSTITITHRWSNLGWGYCPTNIPQWKDKYKVAFALLDKNSDVKHIFIDDVPELCEWISGYPKSYTFSPNISGVTAGEYVWAVGLVDTTKNNEIGIQISAKGDITAGGWLKLTEVTVY